MRPGVVSSETGRATLWSLAPARVFEERGYVVVSGLYEYLYASDTSSRGVVDAGERTSKGLAQMFIRGMMRRHKSDTYHNPDSSHTPCIDEWETILLLAFLEL